jgi:hypothetical protein
MAQEPTAREALAEYYRTHYFGDRALYDRVVWYKLGPFTLPLPNTDGRKRAIALHDLHHLITGYGTDWSGEGEVAAWELAGGYTRKHWAGYLYGPLALFTGLLVAPRRAYRAWRRGRDGGGRNLCHLDGEIGREALLDLTLTELRERTGLR